MPVAIPARAEAALSSAKDGHIVIAGNTNTGRLTERKNGAVVRDLTTRETETGNVYVVAPVPPSVQKAMNVTANELARTYRDTLGMVNAEFAARAQRAVLMVAGRALDLVTPP